MDIKRAFDILTWQLDKHPRSDCMSSKHGKEWLRLSTQEVQDQVNYLSLGFLALGLEKNDKVAIMADNCTEWILTDLALQQIGLISVPLYPTLHIDDARYILYHAEVKAAVVGNVHYFKKIDEAKGRFTLPIFSIQAVEGARPLQELINLGKTQDVNTLAAHRALISENDVFTIIYTSGTTGRSKGVMLSHKNLVSTVISVAAHTDLPIGYLRALSFLPLSHIFERAGVYYYLSSGTGIYFSQVESLSSAMQEIKPHTFSAVPRVLEKVYEKLEAKPKSLTGLQKKIYEWAFDIAVNFEPNKQLGPWESARFALADVLVFKKWREAMGGSLQWVNVGSAALQPRLARLFWAAGIRVAEGYGMTECSPVITANRFSAQGVRIGSVGVAMPNVEIKIDEDGEILVRGPNVMVGYYKEEQQTQDTIKDGWLYTGDIGVLEEGYLRITDRKKEMFKTSNGKYIAPQVLENKLKESPYVDQIMVVGDNQKFPVAMIVPIFERLSDWCKEHQIKFNNYADMLQNPKVIELMEKEVKRFNKNFANWEHIKKIILIDRPWSVDKGELAPTLKLKRKIIIQHFQSMIDRAYA